MKPFHPYFSFLLLPEENIRKALTEYQKIIWQEPEEEDCLRDTVICRKRLNFYRKLYKEGKLSDR